MITITSILARAKNIDYSPDFTSTEFWDTHSVSVCLLNNIDADESSTISFKIITVISNRPKAKTNTVPISSLLFWPQNEVTPQLKIGDRLLLIEPNSNKEHIVASKISSLDDSLVKSLIKIAQLWKIGNPNTLLENIDADDEMLSEYCLKKLLETPTIIATPKHIARLRVQIDDSSRGAYVRILSYRLASKLSGQKEMAAPEYSWLQKVISKNASTDWRQISPFVNRLLEFGENRNETTAFLTGLVKNSKVSLPIRIAAYGVFQDPRLFNFANPDQNSELIFGTCLEMLKDKQSEIRSAGAALLYGITSKIKPDKRGAFAQRAIKSVESALQKEEVDPTKFHLQTYLNNLKK